MLRILGLVTGSLKISPDRSRPRRCRRPSAELAWLRSADISIVPVPLFTLPTFSAELFFRLKIETISDLRMLK